MNWDKYILTPTSKHCSGYAAVVIATMPELRILYAFCLDRVLELWEERYDPATDRLVFKKPVELSDNRMQQLNVAPSFLWYRVPGTSVDRLRIMGTWENPDNKGRWPCRYKDLPYYRPTQYPDF